MTGNANDCNSPTTILSSVSDDRCSQPLDSKPTPSLFTSSPLINKQLSSQALSPLTAGPTPQKHFSYSLSFGKFVFWAFSAFLLSQFCFEHSASPTYIGTTKTRLFLPMGLSSKLGRTRRHQDVKARILTWCLCIGCWGNVKQGLDGGMGG